MPSAWFASLEREDRVGVAFGALMEVAPTLDPAIIGDLAEQLAESPPAGLPDVEAVAGEWFSSEGFTPKEVRLMCEQLLSALSKPPEPPKTHDDDEEEEVEEEGDKEAEEAEEEEDGEELGPGECELCEREMPLTKHHLIPREMHARYAKRGHSKRELNTGISICRPCHSAVHRFWDNKTLASTYSTREALLETEQMAKWIPYIRKQHTTTKEDGRNHLLRYAR
eukprot:m51a1_g13616 hypothetical protein (224) ;mRNA; f:34-998